MLRASCTLLGFARASLADEPPAPLRVATVQMEIGADIDKNLERIRRGIAEASDAGAGAVIFPETALSGFDAATVEKLDWPRLEAAMKSVAAAAAERKLHVIYGSATRREGGRPHNSAIVVGPDGKEITRYQKMVPEAWFEPGERLALFEVDRVPATVIICHDERYPELVRLPVLAGARICFYLGYEVNPLASSLAKMDGYRAQLMARAMENGIWVVQASGIGPLRGDAERVSLGQSRVIDPGGTVVKEAPAWVDAMSVADIDLAAATGKNALRSLGILRLEGWWRAGLEESGLVGAARTTAGGAPLAAPPPAAPAQTKVRLAILKAIPVKWDLEANFKVFLDLLGAASPEKPDLFVTPEGWLDGYAAADKESSVERLRGVAQDLEASDYLRRVAAEAKERGIYICFGFTSLEAGRIYNTAGLWGPDGKRIGVYHKTHLQGHDLQYTAGESLPVWPTPWGPTGIMICADRRWPETARTLRLQGAKLILNPSYGMHHLANEWWMRTRGYENQCFIAFAHPNVGFVVTPKGEVEKKLESDEPGVLICEVDLTEARDDNHLRDRRPELYRVLTAPGATEGAR